MGGLWVTRSCFLVVPPRSDLNCPQVLTHRTWFSFGLSQTPQHTQKQQRVTGGLVADDSASRAVAFDLICRPHRTPRVQHGAGLVGQRSDSLSAAAPKPHRSCRLWTRQRPDGIPRPASSGRPSERPRLQERAVRAGRSAAVVRQHAGSARPARAGSVRPARADSDRPARASPSASRTPSDPFAAC